MIARGLLLLCLIWCVQPAYAQSSSREALIAWLNQQAGERLAKRAAAVSAIRTAGDAAARQDTVRRTLVELIGPLPRRDNPLAVNTVRRVAGAGFTVEVLIFDALPGQRITANLFLPDTAGPHPAVLLSPGHYLPGKLSNYAMGANLARNGIVALAYDLMGLGERVEYWDPAIGRSRGERAGGDHSLAAFQAMATGDHLARTFVIEAMRGVDLLASRAEVDPHRIGAFGCSGGGTVTAYLAAFDDRIAAVAAACYANTLTHLLPARGPQEAEQSIPDFVSRGLDLPDWFELAAPKPYAIISTTEDMFPLAGARGAVEEMRGFWRAFGAENRVEWITGPGPHGAYGPLGDPIVDFFRRTLRVSRPARAYNRFLQPADPAAMLATPSGQLATSGGTVTYADLARGRLADLQKRRPLPLTELRAAIRRYTRTAPAVGQGQVTIDGSNVIFASQAGRLSAELSRAEGQARSAVLLLDPGPIHLRLERADRLRAQGHTVLTLPIRGNDGSEEPKSALVGNQNLLALHALITGKTLLGLRIDDAQRAVDWLTAEFGGHPIAVVGVGTAGPLALHVAALDDRVAEVTLEQSQLSWSVAVARDLQRDLPDISVPGALAAYDLPDLVRAVAPRRVTLAASTDPIGMPLSGAAVRKVVSAAPHARITP